MECPYCDHPKAHRHDRTSKGSQRFKCPKCDRIFTETLNTLYYRRQVRAEEVETILQCHSEGSSLRGVARSSKRAYGTVVSLLNAASQKAQLVHNQGLLKKFRAKLKSLMGCPKALGLHRIAEINLEYACAKGA